MGCISEGISGARGFSRRAFLGAAGAAMAQTGRRPPNIVFILMDDLGWSSLGCYGSKLAPTPHLDRLASEGMRFTDAYVTPQCTPTRATIHTGQYTARNKMWHVIPPYGLPWARMREPRYRDQLPREAFTLAKGLKAAGYATACIGKWHLTANADGNYNGLRAEASHHYGFDVVSKPLVKPDELRVGDKGVGRLTDEAIAFIEANRDRPFFCYLPHHTIHGVVAAPDEIVARYRAKGYPAEGLNNATYLAAIAYFDQEIGRLLAKLDEWKLRENTVVVFLSDNGGVHEALDFRVKGNRLEVRNTEFSNAPLRDGKGSAYEGGIRVPMIVRWPGVVKARTVNRTPVHAVDLMPTFFEIAGASAPEGYVRDGVSLGPVLRGGRIPERTLYWYMPFYDLRWGATPCAVMREARYKLVEHFGDHVDRAKGNEYVAEARLELFDLERDLGETENLAGRMAERAQAMQAKLRRWIESSGAEVPGLNPRFDAARQLEESRGFNPD